MVLSDALTGNGGALDDLMDVPSAATCALRAGTMLEVLRNRRGGLPEVGVPDHRKQQVQIPSETRWV